MYELMSLLLPLAVLIGTLLGLLALAGVLHFTSKRSEGWLHLGFYGSLLGFSVMVLTSGRDISNGSDAGYAAQAVGLSGLATWVIRLVSFGFVLLAAERVASHVIRASSGTPMPPRPPLLLPCFVLFWVCSALLPTYFAAHPTPFKHETAYPLLIGIAFLLSSAAGAQNALKAARNGLTWMNIAGLITAVIKPGLVMDFNYVIGFIPGLPRFTGLTQHAVTYGLAMQFGLFCLWAQPYSKRWVNIAAWGLFIFSLALTQSKTAWVSTLVCVLMVGATNYRAVLTKALLDPKRRFLGAALIACGLVGLTGLVLTLLFADVGGAAARFLASDEGASLTSLTGRDQIWTIALQEWTRYPIFGYGFSLFDENYRSMIGLSAATHSHNQVIDVLAKAGLVGAVPLLAYMAVLLFWSLRYAKATGGLSVLLCTVLYMRAISEIPFVMSGYGIDFLAHALLLALISGAHQQQAAMKRAASHPRTMPASSHQRMLGARL